MQTTPNPPPFVTLPWRIIIDTAEGHPYTFCGIHAHADKGNRPIIVESVRRALGRHPVGLGDYSLEAIDSGWSGIGLCHIERKSLEDCQSTILGFSDGHRDRFEQELSNLQHIILDSGGAAMVVVECSFEQLIRHAPCHGVRPATHNAKTLLGSVLAYQQDYRVPWLFAGGRRLAEIATFRFLERFWKKRGPAKIERDHRW